jgi:hypothetical protein
MVLRSIGVHVCERCGVVHHTIGSYWDCVARHRTFRVRWSAENDEWVATVDQYPSLSWLAATPVEAVSGLARLLDETQEEEESEANGA